MNRVIYRWEVKDGGGKKRSCSMRAVSEPPRRRGGKTTVNFTGECSTLGLEVSGLEEAQVRYDLSQRVRVSQAPLTVDMFAFWEPVAYPLSEEEGRVGQVNIRFSRVRVRNDDVRGAENRKISPEGRVLVSPEDAPSLMSRINAELETCRGRIADLLGGWKPGLEPQLPGGRK